MFTLVNLERAGLLKRKDLILVDTAQPVWQSLRKQLKLIDDREDSAMGVEKDMSYVSAGYAPSFLPSFLAFILSLFMSSV
jgi:hypothetical protein